MIPPGSQCVPWRRGVTDRLLPLTLPLTRAPPSPRLRGARANERLEGVSSAHEVTLQKKGRVWASPSPCEVTFQRVTFQKVTFQKVARRCRSQNVDRVPMA
jgi:hypothetical protein